MVKKKLQRQVLGSVVVGNSIPVSCSDKKNLNMCITLRNHRMEQCCCGCTVKTGSLIIGILEFVGAIAQLGSAGADKNGAGFGSQIASGVIAILITICLLYGIHNERKSFLLPWLVLRGISIFLLPIIALIILILTFVYAAYVLLVVVALIILLTALSYYFWKCVWSFYLDLSDAEMPQTMQA